MRDQRIYAGRHLTETLDHLKTCEATRRASLARQQVAHTTQDILYDRLVGLSRFTGLSRRIRQARLGGKWRCLCGLLILA